MKTTHLNENLWKKMDVVTGKSHGEGFFETIPNKTTENLPSQNNNSNKQTKEKNNDTNLKAK